MVMRDEYGLTPKQRIFADKYIELHDAAAAAREAGYGGRWLGSNASRTLKLPAVQQYIQTFAERNQTERTATNIDILDFWSDAMRNEEAPMGDRLRASELLAKAKLMFREQIHVEGSVSYVDVLAKARKRAKMSSQEGQSE